MHPFCVVHAVGALRAVWADRAVVQAPLHGTTSCGKKFPDANEVTPPSVHLGQQHHK